MTKKRISSLVGLGALIAACGTDEVGRDGSDGLVALLASSTVEPGDECPDGGTKFDYGADANDNGTLDESEIEGSTYVCNGGGIVGNAGPVGAAGPDGSKGPLGPVGPQGEAFMGGASGVGDRGPIGDMGPLGDTGPMGPMGGMGDTGDVGVLGATGDTGAMGDVGPTGDMGATGDTGDKGPTGDKGATGATGDAGATGDPGDKGPVGDMGPTGATGDMGATGVTGDMGATGVTGDMGATGVTGDMGDTGATGDQGSPGATGDMGATGDTGDMGDTGATGDKGDTGATGDVGATGYSTVVSTSNVCGCTTIEVGLDNGDGGGTAYNGVLEPGEVDTTGEVCEETLPETTYCFDFTQGVYDAAECTNWNTYRSLLTGSFSSLVASSSLGETFTCSDSTAATTICNALQAGTVTVTSCDGRDWHTGACGTATALTIGQTTCVGCNDPAYAIRPCVGNPNWGGVNQNSCNAPSQSLRVDCNR